MKTFIKRKPGQAITLETRRESYEKIDKQNRYNQILEILKDKDCPMSAKEIAVEMKNRGYIPTSERNFAHPRITELLQMGMVDCVGKDLCQYSNRMVCKFVIRKS